MGLAQHPIKIGCFQKKKKIINQNFQFLEKIQDFQIFQKKKKIINQNFQFHKKIQDFQIFQKKKKEKKEKNFSKFSIPSKNSSFPNSKKKKKKSSLNSSLGTESYDPLPYFPVV